MVYRANITNCELYVKSSLSSKVVNYCKDSECLYAEFYDEDLAEFVDGINRAMGFMKFEFQRVKKIRL